MVWVEVDIEVWEVVEFWLEVWVDVEDMGESPTDLGLSA